MTKGEHLRLADLVSTRQARFRSTRNLSLLRSARRAITAVRLLARDSRIPRPLRWLAFVSVLPVPGPLDEAVLLLVAALLWVFYRERVTEAWQHTDAPHADASRGEGGRGLNP